jgi:hypothetical protein
MCRSPQYNCVHVSRQLSVSTDRHTSSSHAHLQGRGMPIGSCPLAGSHFNCVDYMLSSLIKACPLQTVDWTCLTVVTLA